MHQTVEAIIEEDGTVRLLEPLSLPRAARALVTILDEEHAPNETALLSESALQDWSREEEDEAWQHLQP